MDNISKFRTPQEIEVFFDADELHLLDDTEWLSLQKQLFKQIKFGSYGIALKICEDIFNSEVDVVNKAFAIQWAVAISEVIYDMQIRSRWIKKWTELNQAGRWTDIFWCQYIYRDQQALGYYFSSNFFEAKRLFEKNLSDSVENNYLRGEMRSRFHLGLIHKCLHDLDQAFFNFQKSLEAARISRSIRFIHRVEEQIKLLKTNRITFNTLFDQVEDYLNKKNFRAARKLVLHLCRIRRAEQRSWFSMSEHLLLALVSYAYKRNKRFNKILQTVNDPLLKRKLLNEANKIYPLSDTLQFGSNDLERDLFHRFTGPRDPWFETDSDRTCRIFLISYSLSCCKAFCSMSLHRSMR